MLNFALTLLTQLVCCGILCVWIGISASQKRPPPQFRGNSNTFWLETVNIPLHLNIKPGARVSLLDEAISFHWLSKASGYRQAYAIQRPKRIDLPFARVSSEPFVQVPEEFVFKTLQVQDAEFNAGLHFTPPYNISFCNGSLKVNHSQREHGIEGHGLLSSSTIANFTPLCLVGASPFKYVK